MKKFLLTLFLLVDMLVVAGASAFLFFYLQGRPLPILEALLPIRLPTRKAAVSQPPATSTPVPVSGGGAISTSTVASPGLIPPVLSGAASGLRNIRFTYKNSKAKEVSIRADFTGWRAKPMIQGVAGVWMFDAQLAPGEYAYCFSVDNRIIPDPASKRSKQIGQNKVSSIEVKPAPVK